MKVLKFPLGNGVSILRVCFELCCDVGILYAYVGTTLQPVIDFTMYLISIHGSIVGEFELSV